MEKQRLTSVKSLRTTPRQRDLLIKTAAKFGLSESEGWRTAAWLFISQYWQNGKKQASLESNTTREGENHERV